jgi:hypothetical protein
MGRPHVQHHPLALSVREIFSRLRSTRGSVTDFNVLNLSHEN